MLIAAGGSGSRMQSDKPKQFIRLLNKPLILYTIDAFSAAYSDLHFIITLPENNFEQWDILSKEFLLPQKLSLVTGGATRFESVRNGLETINDDCIIAIHDAVRPFVSKQLIQNCFSQAEISGNAIPAIRPVDSVRIVKDNVPVKSDRDQIRLIQTPQCFKVREIKKAYQQQYSEAFTDDASVLENAGGKINLIEGEKNNFKITTKEDLAMAEALLSLKKF